MNSFHSDEHVQRQIKWSFGSSLSKKDMHSSYTMRVSENFPTPGTTMFEWKYANEICRGSFHSATATATFNFLQKQSTVIVIYRVLDPNCMAVCIIESEAGRPAIMQYGNMMRISVPDYIPLK